MNKLSKAALAILTICIATIYSDENIAKSKLALELSAGNGAIIAIKGNTENIYGLGITFGVGGYLSKQLALMANITLNRELESIQEETGANTFVGPKLQYWITDNLNCALGLGYDVYLYADRNGLTNMQNYQENLFGVFFQTGCSIINRDKFKIGMQFSDVLAVSQNNTLNSMSISIFIQYK